MKQRILIIGGSGMLGSSLVSVLTNDFEVESPTRENLDLYDKRKLKEKVSEGNYQVIIYAAGLTNQEECEKDKNSAKYLNSEAVKIITKESVKNKTRIIYFSTDAVFDGTKNKAYKETDKKSPINYYGYTKSLGEDFVLGEDQNLVIRLVSLYTHSFYNKMDFVRRSLNILRNGKRCIGISDQFFNPTYTEFASRVIKKTLNKKVTGILHIGSKDVISNFEFIKLVARNFGYDSNLVVKVGFKDFFKDSSFSRGQYQILDIERAVSLLGGAVPTNKKNLDEFKRKYNG